MQAKQRNTHFVLAASLILLGCGGSSQEPTSGVQDVTPEPSEVFSGTTSLQIGASGSISFVPAFHTTGSSGVFSIGNETYLSNVSYENVYLLQSHDENRLVFDATPNDAIPTSGEASYSGTSYVVFSASEIGDASGTYSGYMDTNIGVNFGDLTGTLVLHDFQDGQFSALSDHGNFNAYVSNGFELITVNDFVLNTNSIVDGDQTNLTIEHFGNLDSGMLIPNEGFELLGAVAGPDATEIAGIIGIDDPTVNGQILFIGTE